MIQLLSVEQRRLGFVAHDGNIIGCQHTTSIAGARLGGCSCRSIRLLLLLLLLLLDKCLFRQTVPFKELGELLIAPLQHFDDLWIRPVIHGDMSHGRRLHSERPMTAAALNAHESAIVDNGPFGRARSAVETLVVAVNFVQQTSTGHGKKRMRRVLLFGQPGRGRMIGGCAGAAAREGLLWRRGQFIVDISAVLRLAVVKRPHLGQFGVRQFVQADHVAGFGGRLDPLPPLPFAGRRSRR